MPYLLATLSRQVAKPFSALARTGHLPACCLVLSFSLALCALVVFRFSAASANAEPVNQNRAQILALASADFDEDGVADLVSGSESDGFGIVTVSRGNVAAVYPNSPEAQRQPAAGTASGAAFLSSPLTVITPQRPDFLGAGDFDRDGHWDVIVAARGANKLNLFSGNGKGELNLTKEIYLPGAVTALTAGEINRRDGLTDFAVGIEGGAGAQVLIYESPEGAIKAQPEIFSFAAKVTALAAGQLDAEFNQDLAVTAGTELAIIHGRDRKLTLDQSGRSAIATARLRRYSLPSAARSIALGEFNGQPGTDIAALTEDGAISVTTLARAKVRSNAESTARFSANLWPQATALVCARMSGQKNDDLIVVDPTQRQLNILSDLKPETASPGKNASPKIVSLAVEGQPLTVLSMRLNADAREDLVVGISGRSQVSIFASSPAATFTVNSTGDGSDNSPNDQRCDAGNGQCTLRAAIEESNALKIASTINFNIGNGGLQTIPLRSALPPLSVATTIDGTTQPGFSGRPLIELNGANASVANGLTLQANNCVIRGLVINNFIGSGILVSSDSNFIEGNFLGISSDGLSASRNTSHGIELNAGTNNRIGGTAPSARNIISGNNNFGIFVSRAAVKNLVQGNLIGLNATGAVGLPNGQGGLRIESDGNILGETVAGARNIISGNNGFGISLGGNGVGSIVQGNYIGTDITGTARISNVSGIGIGDVDASRQTSHLIGGTTAGAGNVICGSSNAGIYVLRADNNRVEGNLIGIDVNGTGNTLNGLNGVEIARASDNMIGGTATGAGNTIAFNKGNGVSVTGGGTGNQILANSVFSNGGLGIDLGGDGVTPNDTGDADTGANNLQNFPLLNAAYVTGNTLSIQGRLDSAPNPMTLHFYQNNICDPSGYGQGANFIGSIVMTPTGKGFTPFVAAFQATVKVGTYITATATDSAGNTSEFSQCIQTQQPPTGILVTSLGDNPDRDLTDLVCDDGLGNCTLRAAIQQA
ncbi:MAG: CSLREA domain-containing protein, partial [Acidobacteria bacterium]|nr:CSLREA domain-containing protein [Acidobacteriota bacterium]